MSETKLDSKVEIRVKCQYSNDCDAYSDEDQTCVQGHDKRYCGIYRRFSTGEISFWQKPRDSHK